MSLTAHSGLLPLDSQRISFLKSHLKKSMQKGGKWPATLCPLGASTAPLEGSLHQRRRALPGHCPSWHVKATRASVSPPKQLGLGVPLQAPTLPQLPHLSLTGRISHTPALIVANRTISSRSRIS